MMAAVKPEKQEPEDTLRRAYTLDKIAITLIGAMLMFLVGTLWNTRQEISKMEVSQAEIRGNLDQLTRNMTMLMAEGSRTAQRLEVTVENINKRMDRLEQFMSAGPRFTADDGAKLKERIERLEQQK